MGEERCGIGGHFFGMENNATLSPLLDSSLICELGLPEQRLISTAMGACEALRLVEVVPNSVLHSFIGLNERDQASTGSTLISKAQAQIFSLVQASQQFSFPNIK